MFKQHSSSATPSPFQGKEEKGKQELSAFSFQFESFPCCSIKGSAIKSQIMALKLQNMLSYKKERKKKKQNEFVYLC